MGLEKQLRQYDEWQKLLAANTFNAGNDDQNENEDIQNVSRWSIEIDLRKDIWKYVEITTSTIKEWKNTFINKVSKKNSSYLTL